MIRRTCSCLTDKVITQDFPYARLVTLNKPKALNAIDLDMILAIHKSLIGQPLADPKGLYIMKGEGGKAFCAGGDVVNITRNNPPGVARNFFYLECQLVHHLSSGKANNVALWDGFVAGAGSGVSVPGKYRVATERVSVAMPETGIGMVHVGGSWYLPRLPTPGLGLYMALTQHWVKGADLIHTGIATHFCPSVKLPALEKDLCHIEDPDLVEEVLSSYKPSQPLPASTYGADELAFLENTFTPTKDATMSRIVAKVNMAKGKSRLAAEAATALPSMSPTALVLTLALLMHGVQAASCEESLTADYCVSQRICIEHDFKDGVRALLVEKDKLPMWKKATLEEVTQDYIATYFKPTTPDQVVWDPVKPIA